MLSKFVFSANTLPFYANFEFEFIGSNLFESYGVSKFYENRNTGYWPFSGWCSLLC